MTPGSANHKLAGEKGYLPVSFCISPDASVTARHWQAVLEGAARSGRTPDRRNWRLIRDVYVAPTDREARDLALGGMMGRCWREFLLPLYLGLGLGPLLKGDSSMADEDVDLEYVADNLWLVGSPDTVARRIRELQEHTGGFGYLLITSYDAVDERQSWQRSLQLLIDEVLPACDPRVSRRRCRHELRRVSHQRLRRRNDVLRSRSRIPGRRGMGSAHRPRPTV